MNNQKEKFKIFVSGAAELSRCCDEIKNLAEELGREIARNDCILLTGATTGVPYFAAKGAKEVKGISIGFSPASSRKEHLNRYRLPVDQFDLIIYTGFDYVGRNLIATKAADGVIVACGRIGTLNEFTIAFETGTPIGVLLNTGGTADLIKDILGKGYRPTKTELIFGSDPKLLVKKLIEVIKENEKKEMDSLKENKKIRK